MFDTIIFDLDGTLTDPKEGITKSVQFALNHFGILEPDLRKLEKFIGPPLIDSFIEFYNFDHKKAVAAVEKYRERFAKIGLYENKVYPGIESLLKKLQQEGKTLAIASSKPTVFVHKILEYFKLDSYFTVIMGSELDGKRSKKEDVLEACLKQLFPDKPIPYDTTVMVGDRKFDVEGAKAFGLLSIGVGYGYAANQELLTAGADYYAATVKQLEKILLKKANHPETIRKKRAYLQKPTVVDGRKAPKTLLSSLFSCFYPLALYLLLQQIAILFLAILTEKITTYFGLTDWMLKEKNMISAILGAVASLVAVLFVQGHFFEEMKSAYVRGMESRFAAAKRFFYTEVYQALKEPKSIRRFLPMMILAVSGSYFLNILFGLLKINRLSITYQQVELKQLSVPIGLAVLVYGIITPICEEIVFRGILYNRLKKLSPYFLAMVVQALLFGIYHGNIVQGMYGFLMGMLLAFVYEHYKNMMAPVIFHMLSNLSVLLTTFVPSLSKNWNTPKMCAIFGVISLFFFLFLWKRKKFQESLQ